jgi:hypothetical protein
MKNILVDKRVFVTASFDPIEWGTEDQDVADKLNNRLEFYVNKGYDKDKVIESMQKLLNEFNLNTDYGLTFLSHVVDYIYCDYL